MPPFLVLIGLGRGSWWVPLPLPVILGWPLIGLAFALATVVEAVACGRRRDGLPGYSRTALLALCQLPGLRVDVRRADGRQLLLRML